ncbi:unnamed protein product [Closterium sp. Naga37s-1]|nr:unnamed protein product [Closterium sp. Naga37s-1]
MAPNVRSPNLGAARQQNLNSLKLTISQRFFLHPLSPFCLPSSPHLPLPAFPRLLTSLFPSPWLWQDFGSLNRLDTDSLRLASTWHGLHAIAMQLSPIPNGGGIEMLEAGTFDLHCFQTLTGALPPINSTHRSVAIQIGW